MVIPRRAVLATVFLLLSVALAGCGAGDADDDGADHGGGGDGHDGGHAGDAHEDGHDAGTSLRDGHLGEEAIAEDVRPSIVGLEPYDGPTDAATVRAVCHDSPNATARTECSMAILRDMLVGVGAGIAFDVLDGLTYVDTDIYRQAHDLAHELGRFAYASYGGIVLTLEHCSYKVFAGCFHGALQAFFSGLPAVNQATVAPLCPSDNPFRQYTCLHGVGHGLMLHNHNALNESLVLCDGLETRFARESCHGGVFMENIVGYLDFLDGEAHEHGHGPIHYWVDPDDPYYPCNAVIFDHRPSCWLIQTTLILRFESGNFRTTAAICADEPEFADLCFRSMGRDASSYGDRSTPKAVQWCGYAPSDHWAGMCVAGFVAESILHYVDPERGLTICSEVQPATKAACYWQMASESRHLVDAAAMEALCARVEEPHGADCRSGAGLG